MSFNSLEFAIFLPIVFLLYWFVAKNKLKLQNFLILVASYVFYGWWDYRFLSLIIVSSVVDYLVSKGLATQKIQRKRLLLLLISICTNLILLGFFKYYNFFVSNFVGAFSSIGISLNIHTLKIILPVGISFYTFQTLSYTIDVYRKKLEPTKDIIAFFAFVSFFPQLVAGPIERATNLLPQFFKNRNFDYDNAADGMRQILWGLFKKIVIADNCAIYANKIFADYHLYSGSTLLLGVIFFAFQIYADFSGYTDIAIGTARLFGFSLMRNFAYPYFSRDIAEFWRRWHISLSTWFRDYVYIPLGGNKGNNWKKIRNIFVVFVVSGFWHGANWTFIAWGFLNACYFLPLMLLKKNRTHLDLPAENRLFPGFKEAMQISITFLLTLLAWVFFRAESIQKAFSYIGGIFSSSFFSKPEIFPKKLIFVVFLFITFEWFQRDKEHALQFRNIKIPQYLKWSFYYAVILFIYFFGNFTSHYEFIYFQF